ncbi:MAG: zinc-ribbon domain-containing protein [Syntrophus sp. (in: bacteria)]
MALKKCHECDHDVSSDAKVCPNCGAPVKKEVPPKRGVPKGCMIFLGVTGILFFLIMGFTMLIDSCDKRQTEKDTAKQKQDLVIKEAQRKDAFLKDIENKYQNLKILVQDNKMEDANSVLVLFRRNNQLGYKDVKDLDKVVSIALLKKSVLEKKPGNYDKNLLTYKNLSDLEPDNKLYKNEYDFYKNKVDERKKIEAEKKRLAEEKEKKRLALFGPPPENSPWDGSVSCVKDYLRSVAKDPDSLVFEKWGKVAHNDKDGWLVWCDFRGKNSLGGFTRDVKWFVIRHNNVVAVKNFNAYQ